MYRESENVVETEGFQIHWILLENFEESMTVNCDSLFILSVQRNIPLGENYSPFSAHSQKYESLFVNEVEPTE